MRVKALLFLRWRSLQRGTRETGLEPATSAVTGRCSNQLNYSRKNGRNRTRTYDHLCVRQELYQLSYTPKNLVNQFILQRNLSQGILRIYEEEKILKKKLTNQGFTALTMRTGGNMR
jgi:hypothetical protein